MPSWPIEMPSETEIVPNSSGTPPACRTPSLARFASRSSDRLHGRDLVPRRGDADLRLVPVVVGQADRAKHRARRRALVAIGDVSAARLSVHDQSRRMRRCNDDSSWAGSPSTSGDGTKVVGWRNDGDGPPVLICNGLGTPPSAWPAVIAPEPRLRVATWYYRGTAGGDRPADPTRITVQDHVDDALALLDHPKASTSAVLACWSLGVNVGFELAPQHPDRVAGVLAVAGVPGGTFQSIGGPLRVPRPLASEHRDCRRTRRASGRTALIDWTVAAHPAQPRDRDGHQPHRRHDACRDAGATDPGARGVPRARLHVVLHARARRQPSTSR